MQSRQQPSPTPPYSLHRRPMVFSPDKPDETSTAPEASAPAATPVSSSIKHLLGGLTLGAVSWVLTSTPLLFSVNPLGLALLCATPRYTLWVLGGALIALSSAKTGAGLTALAFALAALARLFFIPLLTAPPSHRRKTLAASLGRAKQQLHEWGQYWHRSDTETDKPAPLSISLWQTEEPLPLRVILAVLCALIPCIGIPAAGGFVYYDLYGAVFYLLALPVATLVFAKALESRWQSDSRDRRYAPGGRQAICSIGGFALLFWAVCFCTRGMSVLGVSPAICLALLAPLALSRRSHLPLGLCAAVLGGLAVDVRTVPLFLIVTLLDALLYPLVRGFSLLPALLAALVYSLLRGGPTMFWALAPSLTVGVLCFSSASKLAQYTKSTKPSAPTPKNSPQDETQLRLISERNRNDILLRRMSTAAGAFGHLSEIFRQLNETLTAPTAEEVRLICDEVLKESCAGCPQKGACWGENYAVTLQSVLALCRAISTGADPESIAFPVSSEEQCLKRQDVIGEVNFRVTQRLREQLSVSDRSQFSHVYDSISHLLRDIVHQSGNGEADFCYDAARSDQMMAYLRSKNVQPHSVSLTGKRKQTVQIFGLSPANITLSEQQLRDDLGRICGATLSPPRYDGSDEGILTLSSLPALRADYVHRCSPAPEAAPINQKQPGKDRQSNKTNKRSVCGDTLRAFEGPDGMFYALLCDGMGSGRAAALTSGSSAVFLEQLLKGGVSVQTALRMLNQYLRTRTGGAQEECCCTVDLFALDLFTGKARFIKSGAANSFLVRDGHLYRISSHTIPIGILQAIDAQVIPFDILPGDRIFMMSDGIADTACSVDMDSTSDGIHTQVSDGWITDLLNSSCTKQTDGQASHASQDTTLIETAFSLARKHGSLDDISMLSIRITKEDDRQKAI